MYAPGSACPPLDENTIACNDDGSGCDNSTSYTQFEAEAGMTYLLRLGGWGNGPPGQVGTGTLTVRKFDPLAPPDNDNCADAIAISSVSDLSFTTIGATTDGPEHPNDCVGGGNTGEVLYNDIWYLYTPQFTGTAELTTCSTADFDTKIAVYGSGASCPPVDGDLIACNEDGTGCGGFTSYTTFDVVSGESYLLRLGGWGNGVPGESGVGYFSAREVGSVSPPPNDDCSNAIELDLGPDDFVMMDFTNVDANTNPPFYEETVSCFDVPNNETAVFQ